jgi:hypothetical protein
MKKQNIWIIKEPSGRLSWATIRAEREECIRVLEKAYGYEPMVSVTAKEKSRDVCWKHLYRLGYRVKKILSIVQNKDGLRWWLE